MRPTFQQRRKRAIIIGILCAIILFALAEGKTILLFINGPKIPGYATSAPAGKFIDLDWKAMQQGQWKYGNKPIVPQTVIALSQKQVHLKGFLLPLHTAGVSSQFFIACKPRGCYFCNPPGVAEVVQINMANGKQLDPTDWPVSVYGTLKVASGAPDDQMLYVINDAVMVAGI